jgi:hypothetical protein
MAFAASLSRPLVHQPQHPVLDETMRFIPDGCPLQTRLATAFRNRFSKEDKGTNDFVVVLNGSDEVKLILGKVLCSRHAGPPAPDG